VRPAREQAVELRGILHERRVPLPDRRQLRDDDVREAEAVPGPDGAPPDGWQPDSSYQIESKTSWLVSLSVLIQALL
jgi:hypothetical protein